MRIEIKRTDIDNISDQLEEILDRDNLNRAYKRVKRNHEAAGINGMNVEEALPWLKEHREELLRSTPEYVGIFQQVVIKSIKKCVSRCSIPGQRLTRFF